METLQLDNPLFDPIATKYAADMERLADMALAGRLSEREYRERVERLTMSVILAVFLLGGGDPEAQQSARFMATQRRLARDSARALAADLFDGNYSQSETKTAEDGKSSLLSRLALWTFTLGKVYHRGLVTAPDLPGQPEPVFRWEWGNTIQHCATCATLRGQEKTKSEWANLAYLDIEPQGTGLECGGWQCDCRLSPVA